MLVDISLKSFKNKYMSKWYILRYTLTSIRIYNHKDHRWDLLWNLLPLDIILWRLKLIWSVLLSQNDMKKIRLLSVILWGLFYYFNLFRFWLSLILLII